MSEAIHEGVQQGLALKEVVPFRIVKICGDDGGFSTVSSIHELEKGVCLFWLQGQISQLVNE
jgi:hypothetical protein